MDNAIRTALDEADRRARWQRALFWTAVGMEAALIAVFLLAADWRNRTHVLLFMSTLGIFYAVGLGVAAVLLKVDDSLRRILQALRSGEESPNG